MIQRALALLAFIAAADLWLAHHFDVGVRDPGALAALVGAVGAAMGLVGKLLSDREKADVGGRVVAAGRLLLTTPLLVVLYLVGATFALTLSTVRVIGAGADMASEVRVIALDDTSVARSGTLPPGGSCGSASPPRHSDGPCASKRPDSFPAVFLSSRSGA